MLAFDVIKEIGEHAINTLGSGRVKGNITTNAYYLTLEKARQLLEYGTNVFHIALDGYGETHHATRHLASGGPTFDQVWKNLIDLRDAEDLNFELRLRIHYSIDKSDKLDELIEAIGNEFSDDRRISVYFTSINNLGGPKANQIKSMSSSDKRLIENRLYKRLDPRVKRAERNNFNDCYVCYAALANSFGVRSDGAVVKCTVALNRKENCVGRIMPNGTLRIDQDAFRPWIASTLMGDFSGAACPANKILPKFL